jgi:L-fuculose-phosphate aldolase
MADVRKLVCQVAQRMANAALALGTAGNVSARLDDKTIAITPTGVPYDRLCEDDIVVVDIHTRRVVSGHLKPSSETPMHTEVYARRSDIHGIVHTHSLYATAFAVAGQSIEAVHYVIATMGDHIPVVPYFTYGTEALAQAAAEALQTVKVALLANHGVLALGKDLEEAYYHAEAIEYLAQLQYLAKGLGGPQVLTPSQIAEVMEKFQGYGQRG